MRFITNLNDAVPAKVWQKNVSD